MIYVLERVAFSPLPTMFSKAFLSKVAKSWDYVGKSSQTTNFKTLSIFKFDENSIKFSKTVENTVGKEEIVHYKQFLLFLPCFQETCTADT